VLVSGTAGTGKTSLAAHFVDAACRRGERVLYMAFEESQGQFVRNMRSIGFDLEPHAQSGLLRFEASRPTLYGLEMHLATMHKHIVEFDPRVVIIDPLTNFTSVGTETETRSMLIRLIDMLKSKQITTLFTSLTGGGSVLEQSEVGVSSLMDTWLLLRDVELAGERNRVMYILKSRGMAHSNQLREFLLTDHGIELEDVYVGLEGVLTGSSRLAQEAREKAAAVARSEEIEIKRRELERAKQASEAQIAAIRLEYQAKEDELRRVIVQQEGREQRLLQARVEMSHSRKADADGSR
jgi:circadian clock protein KaiC